MVEQAKLGPRQVEMMYEFLKQQRGGPEEVRIGKYFQ